LTQVIALTAASEPAGNLFDVDVTDTSLRDDVRGALEGAEVKKIDVEGADAEEEIATAIEGCESVVACIGNRQSVLAGKILGLEGLPLRWCALGAEKVTSAMRAKSIRRLVVLSSFGIGGATRGTRCLDERREAVQHLDKRREAVQHLDERRRATIHL